MIYDLSDTVLQAKTGTYTVTRTARGTTTKGKYTAGTQSTVTIEASVSPLTGEELQQVPELQATAEVLRIITPSTLYVQTSAYDPDVISIHGEPWEVTKVEDWSALGGFVVAFATKKGRS